MTSDHDADQPASHTSTVSACCTVQGTRGGENGVRIRLAAPVMNTGIASGLRKDAAPKRPPAPGLTSPQGKEGVSDSTH